MSNITLYILPNCPFCHKVISFMKKNDIEVPLKDINEGSSRQELMQIGGKTQVPCLIIDGKAMYESDDIIAWLKENSRKIKQSI